MFNNKVYELVPLGTPIVADGSGVPFDWKGGVMVLSAWGTFGGGTVKVQFPLDTTDAGAWQDTGPQNAVATTLTAAGSITFRALPGRYRVTLLGSTAPSLQWAVGEANSA